MARNEQQNSYTNDIERHVYDATRWDARLYASRRSAGGTLEQAEALIKDQIFDGSRSPEGAGWKTSRRYDDCKSDAQVLGREIFSRLYSDSAKLETPNGPAWASRSHSVLDEIEDFQNLQREIGGDPDLAALATASMMDAIAGSLSDMVRESDESQPGDQDGDSAPGLPSTDDMMRAAARAAIKTAKRTVGEAREGLAGLAPGLGSTPPAHEQESGDRFALAEMLRDDPELRAMIRRAGRMQRITDSQHKSMTDGASEIYDITRGNDINRLLPSELTKLAHPATRALLLRNLVQRTAMQYALRSNEPVGRGPIIALLDISTSMEGPAHQMCRSIGLAIAGTAQKEKRVATIADFNGKVTSARRISPDGSAHELISDQPFSNATEALVNIAKTGVAGGTSFDNALSWAADRIVNHGDNGESKADMIIVTDGCDTVTSETAEQLAALRDNHGLRIFACTINGGAIDSNIREICDEVMNLDDCTDPSSAFAKSGWAR